MVGAPTSESRATGQDLVMNRQELHMTQGTTFPDIRTNPPPQQERSQGRTLLRQPQSTAINRLRIPIFHTASRSRAPHTRRRTILQNGSA